MKDFLFVYRADYASSANATPEEQKASTQKWIDWIGSIANDGKLTAKGHPLTSGGKVVKNNNVVTNGPYTELKEIIGGYSIVKADSLEDAAEIAKGCPVFAIGGNVEVRELVPM